MNNIDPKLQYVLQLADTSFVLSHRLAELCGIAPELEIDLALTNISLDLLGEARNLYQYAGNFDTENRKEDDFAYFRDQSAYYNLLLSEQPNEGFDITITRQYLFDVFHYHFLTELQNSSDPQLVVIAKKSIKEASYHKRFSQNWMIRLGDGTAESNQKMQTALNEMWRFSHEMFMPTDNEKNLISQGVAVDVQALQSTWQQEIENTLTKANLVLPKTTNMRQGGKEGLHSEHLGFLLAEMQHIQRSYPNCEW
jgi:ring-1,2-phenylacetyl-CoA epoxidase subunit PaaC